MFLDAAYVAKYYLNEPDSAAVRAVIRDAESLVSSAWTVAEVTSALRRHLREGRYNLQQFTESLSVFRKHAEGGIWTLIPVSEALLWRVALRVAALPADVFLRAGWLLAKCLR